TVVCEIVPIGNQVVDEASGMAKRHAAIHAACALLALLLLRKGMVDLLPVVDSFCNVSASRQFAFDLKKSIDLTHVAPLPFLSPEATSCLGKHRPNRLAVPRVPACTRAGTL